MGIIMRNNIAYSGGGGSETVELSMAEYEAREAAGAIDKFNRRYGLSQN